MLVASLAVYVWLLGRTGQDPNDPLIAGPGLSVGARLQFGLNVVPADWSYTGKLAEATNQDDKLAGFHILELVKPDAAKKTSDAFAEVPCDFIGTMPVLTVFSQDGQKHRFTVDTGAVKTYMRRSLAQSLNFGREDPLPLCLFLPPDKWVHFKAEVDRSIGVLAATSQDFPAEGILGMNALSCMQLKIDYRRRKVWVRVSSKPLELKQASSELATQKTPLVTIPIKRQESGRFTVDAAFGSKSLALELDTGANVIGLAPSTVPAITLDKVGSGQVLVEAGTKALSMYLAPDVKVGEVRFLWPVVHEGVDPRAGLGGFGPSLLPHQTVVLDYPGQRLFTLKPTDEELVEQAAGQLVSGIVRLQANDAILDMPDIVGPQKAVLTKIQDRLTASVISDLRLLNKGDQAARGRLLALYKDLLGPTGHISVLQDGKTVTIEIGHPAG